MKNPKNFQALMSGEDDHFKTGSKKFFLENVQLNPAGSPKKTRPQCGIKKVCIHVSRTPLGGRSACLRTSRPTLLEIQSYVQPARLISGQDGPNLARRSRYFHHHYFLTSRFPYLLFPEFPTECEKSKIHAWLPQTPSYSSKFVLQQDEYVVRRSSCLGCQHFSHIRIYCRHRYDLQ